MWCAVDDRAERILNDEEFDAGRDRAQPDVSRDRITECVEEPNRVATERLPDPTQE